MKPDDMVKIPVAEQQEETNLRYVALVKALSGILKGLKGSREIMKPPKHKRGFIRGKNPKKRNLSRSPPAMIRRPVRALLSIQFLLSSTSQRSESRTR
jgi:hypothetical protein